MKCILPIEESPTFKTYAFWGDYLSILQGKGYDVSGFLYNNFLILSYFMIGNRTGYTSGYKLRRLFVKDFIGKIPPNYLKLLKNNLLKGNYAIVTLNQKKIENTTYDFWHDWLIYGFDDDNKKIFALGYAKECKGLSVFKTKEFTYDDFSNLLPPIGSCHGAKGKYYDNQFLWLPDEFVIEELNCKKIKRNLFRLNKSLILPWENQNIYRTFYYFNSLIINPKKTFDLRPLKSIAEHKRMLGQLFSDTCKDNDLTKNYNEIVKMSEKMLIIAAKYNAEQNFNYERKKAYVKRINDIFKQICHKEKILINGFYNNL